MMGKLKKILIKPFRYAVVFSLILVGVTSYVLLETFVLPRSIQTVKQTSVKAQTTSQTEQTASSAVEQSSGTYTETSYTDDHIQIEIETKKKYDTTYYVVDIKVSDASYLKTALASNQYGRNIKETTSAMAENHNAILAINGDYYGFRDAGFVLRNGTVYRETANSGTDALVIDTSGNFSTVSEADSSVSDLKADGAWQVLSFGPVLVKDGQVAVSENEEVGQAMVSNPRTAIGQVGDKHYKIIVADGRTSASAGLSLYELAGIFAEEGCETAYNLDGGGSSTLVFNGQVINNPVSGRSSGERAVSDIVYIGYE